MYYITEDVTVLGYFLLFLESIGLFYLYFFINRGNFFYIKNKRIYLIFIPIIHAFFVFSIAIIFNKFFAYSVDMRNDMFEYTI